MRLKADWLCGNMKLALYAAFFLLIFSIPLLQLMRYAMHPDYSRYNAHIIFIPFISGYLLYQKSSRMEETQRFSVGVGIPVILGGLLLFLAVIRAELFLSRTDYVAVTTLSVVVCYWGGFLLLFGREALRNALFPLLFLLFLVPIPTMIMEKAFLFLQAASCEITYLLFQLTGMPVFREGIQFSFPGLTIAIAPECSGMRATISLFIVSVLAGHFLLRSRYRKLVLALSTLPITILGNSIRIVALTIMALYIDREFMKGDSVLHERGGWMLFLFDLLLLGGIVAFMRKQEKRGSTGSPAC
jgi:exosortase